MRDFVSCAHQQTTHKYNNNMNTKHFENPCRGGRTYVAPSSKVVEFQPEGVLCESKTGGIGNLTEKDYDGLF